MGNKKKIKFPIFITIFFICIIVYLFTNIKQKKVVCEKSTTFDSNIKVRETVVGIIDGKRLGNLFVQKRIILPEKFSKKEENFNLVKNALDYNLGYLKDNYSYVIDENSIVVNVELDDNQLVLLDNIKLSDNSGELDIKIDPNTKSSEVVALKVGDNYTDGELKKKLNNSGYSCK